MEDKKILPIINRVALIAIGLVIGGFIAAYTGFTLPEFNTHPIEYLYSYSTRDSDVGNTEWKIVFYVINRSKGPLMLTTVYVDEEEAQTYGIVHGENLESGTNIGTNLPVNGYELSEKKGVEIYIWIKKDLYEPGDKVYVSLNRVGIFTEKILVTLNSSGLVEVNKYITV